MKHYCRAGTKKINQARKILATSVGRNLGTGESPLILRLLRYLWKIMTLELIKYTFLGPLAEFLIRMALYSEPRIGCPLPMCTKTMIFCRSKSVWSIQFAIAFRFQLTPVTAEVELMKTSPFLHAKCFSNSILCGSKELLGSDTNEYPMLWLFNSS